MQRIHFDTSLSKAEGSLLIFEAIAEESNTKIELLSALKAITTPQTLFFSNTSSIPIIELDRGANLNGQIMGFHFYNPPPVQKLVELISNDKTTSEIKQVAEELGKRLNKILVPSKDVAGFIGNGHFAKEILFSCQWAKKLDRPLSEAIYLINRVTSDFVLRPMGIFQLLDYVGTDIAKRIFNVMKLQDPLVDQMISNSLCGGQTIDGGQKNGFFSYEKHRINGVLNLETNKYDPLPHACDKELGELPSSHAPWKKLLKSPERTALINDYFRELQSSNTMGAEMAKLFLTHSKSVADELVNNQVANNLKDVNTVLMQGFGHLYGVETAQFEEAVR